MKKLICLAFGLGLLTGCYSIETDMDKAKAERDARRAAVQAAEGCGPVYNHEDYRKCLLQTYENQTPKTYTTATLTNGQPIAVISDRKGASPDNPIEIPTAPTVSIDAVHADVTPMPTTPVVSTTPVPVGGAAVPCKQEVYETQIPADQIVIPCDNPPCAPVVVPQPEQTWWETYKQEEPQPVQPEPVVIPEPVVEPTPAPTLVCPCPDPNDPCPQCNDK